MTGRIRRACRSTPPTMIHVLMQLLLPPREGGGTVVRSGAQDEKGEVKAEAELHCRHLCNSLVIQREEMRLGTEDRQEG